MSPRGGKLRGGKLRGGKLRGGKLRGGKLRGGKLRVAHAYRELIINHTSTLNLVCVTTGCFVFCKM
jgi:hypothetical protein